MAEDNIAKQKNVIKPTFQIDSSGIMAVTLPDAGMEDVAARNVVSRLTNSLQSTFAAFWTEKAEQACTVFEEGKPDEAAGMLLEVGLFLQQVPYRFVQRINRIAHHPDISTDHKLRLCVVIILIHERTKEWVLVREMANELYSLATSQSRYDIAANCLIVVAECVVHEGQPDVARAKFVEAIRFCREHDLEAELLWAYHNLGILEWQQGNREDAFAEWDRELDGRLDQDEYKLLHNLCFLAEKYEQFDRQQAARLYQRVVDLPVDNSNLQFRQMRAESAYRLAVLRLDQGRWQEVLQLADIAIDGFTSLVNYEHRLSWCYQLKAQAYDASKEEGNATDARATAERLIAEWGEGRDRFRALLAEIMQTVDSDKQLVLLAEAERVAVSLDIEARIQWYIVAAAQYAIRNQLENALDLLRQALVLEAEVEVWLDKGSRVELHFSLSVFLTEQNRRTEALQHAQIAHDFDVSSVDVAIILAQAQFNAGYLDDLAKTLKLLERLAAPKRILWTLRIAVTVKQDDWQAAARLCSEAFRETGDQIFTECRDECLDVSKGVLLPNQAPHLGPIWQRGQQQNNQIDSVEEPSPSARSLLPTVFFYAQVLRKTVERLLQTQGRAPSFVRKYLKDKMAGLQEGDFRDTFDEAMSLVFSSTQTEQLRTRGPSDLVLKDDESGRKVRFEFKIWGRNDYAGTVNQLLDYVADDEDIGVVYMVNERKKDIALEYRQIAILSQPNYEIGSLLERPVLPDATKLPHFSSVHRTARGRGITVYHFIHNIWP